MGFSEGFTQGFGMVDTAMQRRKAIELDQAQQARTEAHYQDALKRQGALDQQTIDWRKEDQGLAASDAAYKQSQDAIKNAREDKSLNAEINDKKSARGLQAQSNSIQAAHYDILNKTAQAQLAAANYELRTKQAEDAKIAAMPILDAMQTTDPKTGNVSIAWSSNPATFKQQLAAANAVTHIDYEKLYNNPDLFTSHIQTIKNGLADSNHWNQNKAGVLESLNTTMQKDIEAGKIGQKYDGLDSNLKDGIVKSIKITDAFSAPGGNALLAGVVTAYEMPDGSTKFDNGPMTELRMSNPDKDPNVKVIPLSQIVGKLDAIDQISKSIKNDPEHTKLIQSYIKASKKKPDDKYVDLTSESEVVGSDNSITSKKNKVSVNTSTNETYSLGEGGEVVKGNIGLANKQSANNNSTDKSINPQYQLAVQRLGQENADKAWDAWVLSLKK